jgi:hypothetical protein
MSAAWETERAATLARKAYRYVAKVYPKGEGCEALDAYTQAAYEAERAGSLAAFEDALRGMMQTALEARTARRGAA